MSTRAHHRMRSALFAVLTGLVLVLGSACEEREEGAEGQDGGLIEDSGTGEQDGGLIEENAGGQEDADIVEENDPGGVFEEDPGGLFD